MKQTLPAKETRSRAVAHTEFDRETSGTVQSKRDEPGVSETHAGPAIPLQKKANRTGLPDNLKAGIETLSGHSMDDVKVHYNSAKPARLNAHAYAQGTDIHLAPGQTKHLPHEAWHVVQQKQGRVKPVRQLKQTTPVNDDTGLEREADVMGSKALQMKSGPHTHHLKQNTLWSGAYTPVQRKIGFEIEVPSADIWVTRAEDLEDDGDAKHEGDAKDPGKKQPRVLSKGEVLHQGDGWKLTPDGARAKGRAWTPEYIISAIDETMNAGQIPVKMAAVAKHAQENLLKPKTWSNGGGFSVEADRNYRDMIMGSFHVTGGIRLSQISQLIKTLNQGDKRITDVATRAENISVSGSNYKSVVALVALQISDLVTHKSEDDYSAKRTVGILSRTDLGTVVKKVTKLTRRSTFIAEVLQAANVKADTKLFRHNLPGYVNTNRSIDNQQDLTAGEWLDKLLSGHDFTWSETRNDAGGDFGYDQVGPAGTFNQRADGVVLELRSLDEQEPNIRPVEQWIDVAARYTRLFSMLNRKAAANEVNQSFGTVQDYNKKK